MKRSELIRQLTALARERGTSFEHVREGGAHTVFRFGSHQLYIPRHPNVNEWTARGILRDAREVEL